MNPTTQRLCIWSGPLLMCLFTLGLVVAGFLPRRAPNATAEQVRQMYIDHQGRIRVGCVLLLFGAALPSPWGAAVTVQVKRIEGRWAPLSLTQFAGLVRSCHSCSR
jgi:hypothetical protein